MKAPDISRRIGRFHASSKFFERHEFRIVMASCAIVRCEHLFALDVFEYVALSPQFESLEVGRGIPQYEWILTVSEPLGQVTARAVIQP